MTQSEYAARITSLVTENAGPNFEFPDSFDGDVQACFLRRMTPEAAAAKLLADWTE